MVQNFVWKKHLNKASFFIKITIDPLAKLLDINASNVQSRSVIAYKDELILEDFDWVFGVTPAFRVNEFSLTAKTVSGNFVLPERAYDVMKG